MSGTEQTLSWGVLSSGLAWPSWELELVCTRAHEPPMLRCRVLKADDDVANCVQCHPHLPVLATSGIDHAIKVRWGTTA